MIKNFNNSIPNNIEKQILDKLEINDISFFSNRKAREKNSHPRNVSKLKVDTRGWLLKTKHMIKYLLRMEQEMKIKQQIIGQ